MKKLIILIAMLVVSCAKQGFMNGDCNPDGTCNAPSLQCLPNYSPGRDYSCQPRRY